MRPYSLVFLLSLALATAHGQTVTGTLEGRVTDAQGAAVAGAKVTALNAETGLKRGTTANGEGLFQLTFLPIGPYTVTVEAQGFAKTNRETPVELSAIKVLDFSLKLASVSTEMTVTDDAPVLETSRGDLKATIEKQVIEDRPLSSRNILSLVEMLPGFQSSGGYSGVNNPTLSSGSYVSFNGTGTRSASFQIDGVGNDDSSEGTNRQNVNISAIREFQVLANAYPAEFGRAGGAVVLVQTKSGTNRYHGDLYEFLQNEKLNANGFFANSFGRLPSGAMVQPRAPYRRNQYGFTFGGPIVKNKLFFFLSFEQSKHVQYSTFNRFTLPEGTKIQVGDCKLCVNPAQHPNLQADVKWMQGILDRFPKVKPNNPVACPTCYTEQKSNYWPAGDMSGKMDYQAGARDTFAARFQYSRQRRRSAEFIPGEAAWQNNKQQNGSLTWTHMFGQSTWGEFRYGLGLRTTRVDISAGNDTPIVRINNPTAYSITTLGSAGSYPINRFQTDHQFVYNFSMIRGKHSIRTGIDWRRLALDDVADNYSRGWWTFAATGVVGTADRYEGWENFLRGYVTSFQKGYGSFSTLNRMGEMNQYLMDDWKVLPTLTLNLGVRWEAVFAPSEVNNRIKYNYGTFNGVQPRFGLAWTPAFRGGLLEKITGGPGRSAVRAGFGMFNNRIFMSVFSQGGASLRSSLPYGVYRSFDPGYNTADPSNGFLWTPDAPNFNPGRIDIARTDPGLRMPSIQQYHLTLERQLPSKISVSIGYNRTRSIGLLQNQIVNRAQFPILSPVDGVLYDKIDANLGNTNPAPGYISIAQPRTNQRRPDKNYGNVYIYSNNSWAYYNALRIEVKKRYSNSLHWQAAYVFGKTIDTGSDITAGATITENAGPITMRGLSDLHQAHRLNLNAAYTLPWYAKSRGFVHAFLGGWKVSANSTMASGNPFTVTSGYDTNADGLANDRPILLDQSLYGRTVDGGRVDPSTGQQISVGQLPISGFFATYATPTAQRPFDPGGTGKGTLGRNTFFGQGIFNLDLGVHKVFHGYREGHSLTFRAEMFGATNTPRFGYPTRATNSQSFGRIVDTYSPFNFVGAFRSDTGARMVMLGLRYAF
ncbi:MAG: TonB-dependent receptor [Acidobacteria bacterium]|nr:TonB-dependent receptor [Acidobacteriota bacterium]